MSIQETNPVATDELIEALRNSIAEARTVDRSNNMYHLNQTSWRGGYMESVLDRLEAVELALRQMDSALARCKATAERAHVDDPSWALPNEIAAIVSAARKVPEPVRQIIEGGS